MAVLPPPIQESPRVEASTVYSGRCVAYSFIAMFCFGVTNYLIAVATGVLDNSVEKYYAVGAEWKMLAIIWGVGGLPGMLCCAGHWLHAGRVELFWSAESADTPSITWKTKALTLIGGLGLGVSMSLMKKAFVFTSPADKGPVSAVLCSTIIVVSVYGHFMFRELLSKRHALLIGIVVCGVLISALGPGGSTKAEDEAAATGQQYHEALGFMFAVQKGSLLQALCHLCDDQILSMLAFAATTLLVRHSAIGGVSTWSAFSARLLSQTAMAILVGYAFVKSDEGKELPPLVLPNEVVALAVLAGTTQSVLLASSWTTLMTGVPTLPAVAPRWIDSGVTVPCQVTGFFALNLALSYPHTSLVNVVVSANSIIVLGLNFAIDGLLPCPSQLLGMLVILLGREQSVPRKQTTLILVLLSHFRGNLYTLNWPYGTNELSLKFLAQIRHAPRNFRGISSGIVFNFSGRAQLVFLHVTSLMSFGRKVFSLLTMAVERALMSLLALTGYVRGPIVVQESEMPGPSLPIISGPLPSGIQVFAYDVSADTCFVVTDDGDSIMTFQAKSTTFTKSVHCGVVEYEFQNGYASGLKLIGFPRVFASNIKDPMKADAGFGWRSGMTENNICKQGVSLIEDRLRGRTGSFETRLCSEMQELFAGVLDG